MKVVLMHDWLTGFRGGERVLEALCEMFPEAPIYTLLHKKGSTSPTIESREIITSFLDKIPGIHENYRNYLPLMPLAAEKLKITHKADLLISSSHCVIKGVQKPARAKHLCYMHSPMRYIYDQFESYFGHLSPPKKLAAHLMRPYLQFWDYQANGNIDQIVANSHFVAQRIAEFYHCTPKVIHPFVDLKDFRDIQNNLPEKENYFLMVTAFAPNKRVDLAIDTFNSLGDQYKLKIVGSGSKDETTRLKNMAHENIEFLGNVERNEIINLMAKAKAFIFPGIEDFGITPLESLAAGTPVIAYRAGGVLDSLNDQTALFFNDPNKDSLIKAVTEFSSGAFTSSTLINRANLFSKEHFKENILAEINQLYRNKI